MEGACERGDVADCLEGRDRDRDRDRKRKPGPRRFMRGLRCFGLLILVWLLVSLVVAHRLTQRRRLPFEEPVPNVNWAAFESARLTTRDGERLGAWYGEGSDPSKPSVLLLHGNGGGRGKCLSRAELFAREGFTVFLITLRAHGDSTGEFNDIGLSARHDVVAAVEYLEQRRPGRPVVVHGTSMGAAAAVFASRELGRRIGGYLLESPYQHLRRAVRNRTENALPPILDWVAYQGLVLASWLVLPNLDAISPVEAVGGIPPDVPIMILAGGADRLARLDEAQAIHDRVKSHAQLIIFEDAGHVRFLENDFERYRRTILGFVTALRPQSGPSGPMPNGTP